MKTNDSPLLRYGVAVLATALVLLLRFLLNPVLGSDAPLIAFILAVAVAAWYGGIFPGLVALVLSLLAGIYFFVEPAYALSLQRPADLARALLFVGIGTVIALLNESLRTARRRAEQSALAEREAEARYRALVGSITDYALLLLDTRGQIVSGNPGVENVLGYREEEIVGQHISRIFTPEDVAEGRVEQELRQAEAEGKALDERWHVRKDGRRFWATGVVQPVRGDAGELRGFTKIMRDVTESKQAVRRLAVQHAVSQVLVQSADLETAMPRLLQAIGEGLEWEMGAFWILEGARDALCCPEVWHAPQIRGEGFKAATRQMRFPRGVGLPGRVWESGSPLWIADVTSDDNFPRLRVAAAEGLHAAFAFPVRSASGIHGVIEFFSREIRPPDPDLLQAVASLGSQIGQFLERTRAEQAVHVSEARKAAVLETALDSIITMDHTGRVVEFNPAAERSFGYSREEALGREMAELIIPPALREQHRAGLARYLSTGEGPVLGSRIEVPALRRDGSEFPAELAIVPILSQGPPLFTGYLRDITRDKETAAHLETLYQKQQRIAETLQRSLLLTPPEDTFPHLTVSTLYDSALDEAAVGGDFFDTFALAEDRVALVVGDVSGKGLAAAAHTAELKYALRAYLREDPDAARALQRLNRYLYENARLERPGEGTYVALALAVVEPATGRTAVSAAAMEPPLVLHADGSHRIIEAGGLPLGVDPEEPYPPEMLCLSPGDTLLMFTDGIAEARCGRSFFGIEGVLESAKRAAREASLKQVAQTILSDVQSFAGGTLRDDACLLLARRRQETPPA